MTKKIKNLRYSLLYFGKLKKFSDLLIKHCNKSEIYIYIFGNQFQNMYQILELSNYPLFFKGFTSKWEWTYIIPIFWKFSSTSQQISFIKNNYWFEIALYRIYEMFFTSELVPGSKIALFFPNFRYQALTQRWSAVRNKLQTILIYF